jgi:hypothetical protein
MDSVFEQKVKWPDCRAHGLGSSVQGEGRRAKGEDCRV